MKYLLVTYLTLLASDLFGQSVWNQAVPLPGNTFPAMNCVSMDGNNIIIGGGTDVIEVDPNGAISGKITFSNFFHHYSRKMKNPATGEIIFLNVSRKFSSVPEFGVRLVSAENGLLATQLVPDNIPTSITRAPAVLAPTDSTLFIFGKEKTSKIIVRGLDSLVLDWQQPLNITSTYARTAVQAGSGFVVFGAAGDVVGVDAAGQQTFSKLYGFNFNESVSAGGNIFACGSIFNTTAILAKLNDQGDTLWTKQYADRQFYDVQATPDGQLLLIGRAQAGSITLHKMDLNGNILWTKTYQDGTPTQLLLLPDGGCFILGSGTNPATAFGIKTDINGNTVPLNRKFEIQNRVLSTPRIQASFDPTPFLFYNNNLLLSPSDSWGSTPLSFSPWLAGTDEQNVLHLSADDHYSQIYYDMASGVIGGVKADLNRVWKVSKASIDAFRADYLDNQVLDAPVPFDILTWPAKGNQAFEYNLSFGRIATDRDLWVAPFVDVNNDGKYDPFVGDYPKIKGDQMAWWVLNDAEPHTNSYGNPLQVELAISAYTFDCPQQGSLEGTLFVDFDFVNRSGITYQNAYLGFFTDFYLGCYDDEFVGSLPDENAYYVYNQGAPDDNCLADVFGTDVPIQSVSMINQQMDHFQYFKNLGVGNPSPQQTDPSTPVEFLNYLKGLWRDGTPLTEGGSGYNPGSTNVTNFAFPGNPSDPNAWSMCTANLPVSDLRILPSKGPFTLGDSLHISVAFTTHEPLPLPCPDVASGIKPAISQVTTWANTGALASVDLGVVQQLSTGETITLGTALPGATYTWSTGATTPQIAVSTTGTFTVTVTNAAGCEAVETVLVQQNSATHAPNAPDWTIAPNPAADVLRVNLQQSGQWKAIVRNGHGLEVRRVTTQSDACTISLEGLPAGLYWLEMWDANTRAGGRKFVHVAR